tara:strand:- start:145 stop:642 length:498 start_codon:yes stop_codon:yes gene_type:complete
MSNLSKGRHALAISDRSGMAFPYREMVTEWNGSFVHISEYESKQPQLEPTRFTGDPQGLLKSRPARVEPATENLLPGNPFNITSGSQTIIVTELSHGRANGSTVVFRNVDGSPGGLAYSLYQNVNGFVITVLSINTYSFTLGSTPNTTEQSGGMTDTAGPVTLTP